MKRYPSLYYWENAKNLNHLVEFRKLFHSYVDAHQKHESKHLADLRSQLITKAVSVEKALSIAAVPHWMNYGSAAGGYRAMSITHELPEYVKNQYSPLGDGDDTLAKIDDLFVRAIGIYENNRGRALANSLNPFMYLNSIVRLLLVPIFTILSVKPESRDSGGWRVLQFLLRVPAYYITVVHPLILLMGKSAIEENFFRQIFRLLQ